MRGGLRDLLDQLGQLARHAPDLDKCGTGVVRQPRPLHHALRAALHGVHRVLGIGLNRADQRADLLGGLAGTFGQALHFFRHHREAAACLAG
ncbi:hypothetical protein D3C86_1611320 [compost metagenome]